MDSNLHKDKKETSKDSAKENTEIKSDDVKEKEQSVKNNGKDGETLDNKDKSEDAKDKEPSVKNSEGVKISDNKDKSNDAKDNKKPMGFMQSCCDLIIYFIYSL